MSSINPNVIPVWLVLILVAVFVFGLIGLCFISIKLNNSLYSDAISKKATTKSNKTSNRKPTPAKWFEFSKLIYILNLIAVAVVVGFSIDITYKSGGLMIGDLSVIGIICTAAFAELSVHSVMYSRKAQAENVLKIAQAIKDSRDNDIEYEDIQIANSIYKDQSDENGVK